MIIFTQEQLDDLAVQSELDNRIEVDYSNLNPIKNYNEIKSPFISLFEKYAIREALECIHAITHHQPCYSLCANTFGLFIVDYDAEKVYSNTQYTGSGCIHICRVVGKHFGNDDEYVKTIYNALLNQYEEYDAMLNGTDKFDKADFPIFYQELELTTQNVVNQSEVFAEVAAIYTKAKDYYFSQPNLQNTKLGKMISASYENVENCMPEFDLAELLTVGTSEPQEYYIRPPQKKYTIARRFEQAVKHNLLHLSWQLALGAV